MSANQNLTIGILAHVDAGKTSLTECLLHQAGATKAQGSVDKGSAITDGLALEKSRGISIKAASVNFSWKERQFQLVDTPGHIDFAAEVDRALSILDAVILVVSAKEGVQAHTLNLWESLKERNLPVIIFFNKIDRDGVFPEQGFADFQKDLGAKLFALNLPDLSDSQQIQVVPFEACSDLTDDAILEHSLENLAECDEAFLERYLEANTDEMSTILAQAIPHIQNGHLYPVLFGSAKLGLGIDALLDHLDKLIPPPQNYFSTPAAKVF